ncbi:hypothetical protein AR445_00220 [Klebsiella quasipneumoniae]|nr:hypothetical protein AR445_00220 [Klebsiella quasipneumoniae]
MNRGIALASPAQGKLGLIWLRFLIWRSFLIAKQVLFAIKARKLHLLTAIVMAFVIRTKRQAKL